MRERAAMGRNAGRYGVGLPERAFVGADGRPLLVADEEVGEELLVAANDNLASVSPVPLVARAAPLANRAAWWGRAVVLSAMLHIALAGTFLFGKNDEAMIAGGAPEAAATSGNATADQRAAGETVDVTIMEVSMIDAQPVAEPVQAMTPVEAQAQPVEQEAISPVQTVRPAEPVKAVQPEVLAADTLRPVEEDTLTTAPADPEAPIAETEEIAPVRPPAEAVPIQEKAIEPLTEPEVVEPVEGPVLADQAPLPTPRPAYRPPQREAAAEKPASRRDARRPAAGSAGDNAENARRGTATGRETGKAAASGDGGGRNAAAGNAAVSNYPGKVVSKLRRAIRYPAAARRQRLRGEVHVQFTVSGNGGIGGVRVVKSSGHELLDRAALETVRRAAPFPRIPEGAGRASWPFTVPLAFKR